MDSDGFQYKREVKEKKKPVGDKYQADVPLYAQNELFQVSGKFDDADRELQRRRMEQEKLRFAMEQEQKRKTWLEEEEKGKTTDLFQEEEEEIRKAVAMIHGDRDEEIKQAKHHINQKYQKKLLPFKEKMLLLNSRKKEYAIDQEDLPLPQKDFKKQITRAKALREVVKLYDINSLGLREGKTIDLDKVKWAFVRCNRTEHELEDIREALMKNEWYGANPPDQSHILFFGNSKEASSP